MLCEAFLLLLFVAQCRGQQTSLGSSSPKYLPNSDILAHDGVIYQDYGVTIAGNQNELFIGSHTRDVPANNAGGQ